MTRRFLLAALGFGFAGTVMADDRPAVRLGAVRVDENVVRAQSPETTPLPRPITPMVTESRQVPPPVTMAPAMPAIPAAPPMGADGGLFMPSPDAPLYGDAATGRPFFRGNWNTANHAWFINAEYVHWWAEGMNLPALVTTSPAASNGILGNAGTTILYGGGEIAHSSHDGGRFDMTYWFGTSQCWGLEIGGFFLNTAGDSYTANSTSTPVIARPFFNLNQNIQYSQIVASPNLATGGIGVNTDTSLWGMEANLRKRLNCSRCFRIDGLLGFRYAHLEDDLTIVENFTRTPNSPPSIGVPNAVSGTATDSFSTRNDFYGGQLGFSSELRRGRWFINSTAKVALGSVNSTVTINGAQNILLNNGTTTTAAGGLLALPGANIGTFSRNSFSVLPEIGVNLGVNLTANCRVYVGYNFMYLSNVLRAGDQIDTGLDVARIPNFPVAGVTPLATTRPAVTFKDTGMSVQGISFGLQYSW